MLTGPAIHNFLAAKRAKGLSLHTIESYRYSLALFQTYFSDLPEEPEPIEALLARLGPSDQTRETYFRRFRAFYRWLHRRKRIAGNPMDAIERPVVRHRIARALTPSDLHQLIEHPGHPEAVRAFLLLLADTGMRLSEALSIGDYQQRRERTVTVKGKVGEREIPVTPAVLQTARIALPWAWSSSQAAGWAVRKAFRRAGLSGRRASAQSLRHTFVRLWDGDESLLVGIMGWTTARMLQVYKPYDIQKAIAQHRGRSPLAKARTGAHQLALL